MSNFETVARSKAAGQLLGAVRCPRRPHPCPPPGDLRQPPRRARPGCWAPTAHLWALTVLCPCPRAPPRPSGTLSKTVFQTKKEHNSGWTHDLFMSEFCFLEFVSFDMFREDSRVPIEPSRVRGSVDGSLEASRISKTPLEDDPCGGLLGAVWGFKKLVDFRNDRPLGGRGAVSRGRAETPGDPSRSPPRVTLGTRRDAHGRDAGHPRRFFGPSQCCAPAPGHRLDRAAFFRKVCFK